MLVNFDRICLLKNIFKLYKLEIYILDFEYELKCDEILNIVSDLEKYLKKGIIYYEEVIKIIMMFMDFE